MLHPEDASAPPPVTGPIAFQGELSFAYGVDVKADAPPPDVESGLETDAYADVSTYQAEQTAAPPTKLPCGCISPTQHAAAVARVFTHWADPSKTRQLLHALREAPSLPSLPSLLPLPPPLRKLTITSNSLPLADIAPLCRTVQFEAMHVCQWLRRTFV